MTQVADSKRIDTIEYDGVKVVYDNNTYTATVVRCVGCVRVSTVYPLNWVANDKMDTCEFIRRIKTFDQQTKQLSDKLGLPW